MGVLGRYLLHEIAWAQSGLVSTSVHSLSLIYPTVAIVILLLELKNTYTALSPAVAPVCELD